MERMGKTKKRFNWKARQGGTSLVKNTPGAKDTPVPPVDGCGDVRALVLPEIEGGDGDDYYGLRSENDTNAFVLLPSSSSDKSKKKQKQQEPPAPAKLSKKKRKFLQNILERKNKKEKRTELLEALQKCSASQDVLSMLHSSSHLGQKDRPPKRKIETSEGISVNCIKGANKRARTSARYLNDEEDVTRSDSTDTDDVSSDPDSSNHGDEPGSLKSPDETTPPGATEGPELSPPNQAPVDIDAVSSADESGRCGGPEAVIVETKDIEEEGSKETKRTKERKPAVFVPVARTPEIQTARLCLPILSEEQAVMEAINNNPVTVICGETGSGKTTQVPQFLYEAGYASDGRLIGVTEPRRVAAVSMSQRIGLEMNLTKSVSYQIRYEGNVTDHTKVKLMTDGVLLKEIQNDFLLNKYSVIVIDEAHERSVYTDIIIGLMSRIIPLRLKKGSVLRMVIMSATLRVEDFTNNNKLFKIPPPVVEIDARQHPVTVHFNRRTNTDYLSEAYRKVCKIHRTLPEGGVLIFVTGQQEVQTLCRKLRSTFPNDQAGAADTETGAAEPTRRQTRLLGSVSRRRKNASDKEVIDLDNYPSQPLEDAEADLADDEIDEDYFDLGSDDDDLDEGQAVGTGSSPLHVLPLYSLLPSIHQAKVFQDPPDGRRLCVVATNVAETSLTIPGVKYVVDTGKVKKRVYDRLTGISSFVIASISKASANQRAGRAGRVCPGHCYRLYSSAVFQEFQEFSPAEVTRRPVEDLVLQMKDLNIDKVINFPFLTPPSKESIMAAEKVLTMLGAVETDVKQRRFRKQLQCNGKITELGRAMATFPLSPRFSKMICLSMQHKLLPYISTIVSALTVQEIFTDSFGGSEATGDHSGVAKKVSAIRKSWAGAGSSLLLGDLMVLLKAVGACEHSGSDVKFCQQFCLRLKAMQEIRKLRSQLINAVNTVHPEANAYIDNKMSPPTAAQVPLIRQIVLAGLCDRVARKMPLTDNPDLKYAYSSQEVDEPVFIHPSSVLFKTLPEYVVYHEIVETSKLYMKGLMVIEPEWLPVFASSLCTFSKPLEKPCPIYEPREGAVMCSMNVTYGSALWSVPPQVYKHPPSLDRYRWFANFLLDGEVFTRLKTLTPSLLSPPSTMVKSWARLQSRTEQLLKALVSENADSKEALFNIWHRNKQYLLNEYCEWVDKSKHEQVHLMWPPL